MKKINYTLSACLFVVLLFSNCGSSQSSAQKEAKAQEIQQKMDDFRFTFNATYASPTGFRPIYLSPFYDLKVSKDSVQAYLPYYGRTYVAPMNPSEGGYKFTSTDFEYKVSEGKKKGNWRIEINPKDVNVPSQRDVSLLLDVWENGNARLDVISTDRQPISFQGEVE
ncbi:MAG: DUF4251 domain-containing protein [Dysgonamonadaceae bacterium]|jgi:hypothetical protein|nr:DUF4251 domain-containing protein [Dysgonamonadaceae bacterium]